MEPFTQRWFNRFRDAMRSANNIPLDAGVPTGSCPTLTRFRRVSGKLGQTNYGCFLLSSRTVLPTGSFGGIRKDKGVSGAARSSRSLALG